MDHSASDAEKAKFPGVFVRHKGHKETIVVFPPKKLEHLRHRAQRSDSELDSPKSNQSEEFAISSCTSCCSLTTSTAQAGARHTNSVSSECGMTMSDSEAAASSTDDTDGSRSDAGKLRRSKRKKGKEKTEDNTALDPVRYKTKMCKNWQMLEKCPYGPRCLFAHGTKEMRTYNLNHNAISTACSSSSPERQFYAVGHFPNFMPLPFNAEETGEEEAAKENVEVESTEAATTGQYTHSPYSSIIMEQCGSQQSAYAQDCTSPPVMGPLHDPYFFHHRPFHPQMPVFPQMPFPQDCGSYGPQYQHMPPYQPSSDIYPVSYFQPVR